MNKKVETDSDAEAKLTAVRGEGDLGGWAGKAEGLNKRKSADIDETPAWRCWRNRGHAGAGG